MKAIYKTQGKPINIDQVEVGGIYRVFGLYGYNWIVRCAKVDGAKIYGAALCCDDEGFMPDETEYISVQTGEIYPASPDQITAFNSYL